MAKKTPDFKETIAFQKFRSRIQSIHQHLQIIDASLSKTHSFLKSYSPSSTFISIAMGEDNSSYNKLNHPVKGSLRIINYSRGKNAEYTIIELYSSFSEYMKNILEEMYRKEPLKIVQKIANDNNKDNNITFAEIVELGDFQKISKLMVSKVFRKLENERSTTVLLEKILNHTKITHDENLKKEALMYLQMRHLFIHNKGVIDDAFFKEYGKMETPNFKIGGKLPTTFLTVSNAIIKVTQLCENIDNELIKNNLVIKRELVEKMVPIATN